MRQELKGRIEYIAETRTFSSGFQVRDFVVEIGEEYPQYIKLQFDRENCSKLDSINIGMEVHVEYFLNGRKWDGPEGVKYFTNLRAANIQILDARGLDSANPATPAQTPTQKPKVDADTLTPPLTSAEVPKASDPSNSTGATAREPSQKALEEENDLPF